MLAAGSEKALLGDDDGTICLRKQLLVDGKKEQEPRVLVRGLGCGVIVRGVGIW